MTVITTVQGGQGVVNVTQTLTGWGKTVKNHATHVTMEVAVEVEVMIVKTQTATVMPGPAMDIAVVTKLTWPPTVRRHVICAEQVQIPVVVLTNLSTVEPGQAQGSASETPPTC